MSSHGADQFSDGRERKATVQPKPRLDWRRSEFNQAVSVHDPLSGLTADERRVHHLLLNALGRENSRLGLSSGLSYAEKKRVAESLDLDFIQREIDQMDAARSQYEKPASVIEAIDEWKGKVYLVIVVILLPAAVWRVFTEQTIGSLLLLIVMGAMVYLGARDLRRRERLARPVTRQKIYEDLRELAIALDLSDSSSSPSLRRADLLIDSFATADRAPASRPRTRS